MLGGRVRAALAVVIGGTASSQLIIVLTSPILTRIYSPSEFGRFSAFSAVVAITGVISALRFESAVPIPRDEKAAHELVWLGLFTSLVTGVVGIAVTTIASIFGWWDAALVSGLVLLLVPITSTLFGFSAVLSQLAIRQQRYHRYAVRKLIQAIAIVTGQVALGYLLVGPIGLILGYAIGQLCVFISLTINSGLTSPRALGLSYGGMKKVAGEYRRFPLVLAPSGLLNTLGLQAPILLVAGLYGAHVAGWFGLTQKVLAAPVALLGTSIAQVYLGELASHSREQDPRLKSLFRKVSLALGSIAVVLAIGILVTAPVVFDIAFGDEWRDSGVYAQLLAAGIAGQLLAAPISQTLIVLGRTTWQLGWDTLRLVATASAVLVPSALGWSATEMVATLGVALAASYILLWLLCWRAVRLQH